LEKLKEKGSIDKKFDLGDYLLKYGESTTVTGVNPTPGLHVLTSIAGKPDAIALDKLDFTSTDFGKIATLHEGIKDDRLSYGVNDQRRLTITQLTHSTNPLLRKIQVK
jgi:hypothetical protein